MATERIYVFDAVHDVFVDKVVELAAQLTQGPPLGPTPVDVGAMTMPGQIDIVENLVADAVTKGACVRVGGTRRAGGQFYAPTVLTDVDHSMKIMREETFGPVLAIARVRDEAHAIELANDTAYGLSSSVFTRSRKRAARIARQIRAGSTIVNDFGLGYMAQALPFGGVGGSGYGRLNGREGLRACTNIKAIVSDRFPLHRPVKLFPVRKGDYELTKGLIRLVYEQTWPRRVQAVVELSKTLIERARSR
jgi:acyl-CoA reductase-like NAD-dependent aldehyde dehydrogenase